MEFNSLEEFYKNAERWKKEYMSLKLKDKREECLQRKKWKNAIYSIKCKKSWKLNKIWEYLNNDINYYELGEMLEK